MDSRLGLLLFVSDHRKEQRTLWSVYIVNLCSYKE